MTLEPAKKIIANLDMDRIMSQPVCPDCGFPLWSEPCENCVRNKEEEKRQEAERRAKDIKRLGGLKAYETFTFSNYDNQPAVEKCYGYPDLNLYIYGDSGSGKTHLATAIIRQFTDGIVLKPQHILRKMRGLKSGEEEQAIIDKLVSMKHMVIDDLGVEKNTDFSLSSFYEVIEGRDMNYTKGLIVTSNLSLASLAERIGDDRIVSRLAGMCKVVNIKGTDRRILK